MKRIHILVIILMLTGLAGVPGVFAGRLSEDFYAEITTRGGNRIPPQQFLSKEIALKRPVVVSGRITDKGGEPISAVMVYISNLQDYESIQDSTKEDGTYRIELPANETATTYKMGIMFLSGEFEADSNKIFREKGYVKSSKDIAAYRASNSMCLNALLYLADKKTNAKKEVAALELNIAHQKESILTKKAIEAAKDIVGGNIAFSISISIKERLIARFEEMRKIYPDEIYFFEALGIIQYDLKNLPNRNYRNAAINRFRKAVKLNSQNLDVYHKLIDLLAEAGYYGESIQVAVRAVELFGDDPEMFEDKQELEWLIRRSKFHFMEQDKEKELTEEEKNRRSEWSLTIIEDQRDIYRKEGYPNEIKQYKRREGIQEEWWYYDMGICYIFLNGMLNTKKEF